MSPASSGTAAPVLAAGLAKCSTIDFPGRLACILFTAGCNYDCGFCHNRSLLYTDTLLDEDEVWSFLRKRASWRVW